MTIIWCMIPEIWSPTDRIFLSFWIFCPFTPLTTQKLKILKKWKKHLEIYHHFTQVYRKSWSYAIKFLRYGTRLFLFFILGYFFPFTLLTAQKIIILKKWKSFSSFYTCVPKIVIRWFTVPEIRCATDGYRDRWMDGRTDRKTDGWRKDRRTNRHTEGWTDRLMDGQMENGQMDGRTDRPTHRQIEKVIYRGRCPIKNCLQFQEIKCSSCVQI